jgi:hypothetical protein
LEATPSTVDVREQLLHDGLIAPEDVVGWVESAVATGTPIRPGPFLTYAAPEDQWVRRIQSTAALEPLRKLRESLARRYPEWGLARATIFVLTGKAPLSRPRVRELIHMEGGWVTTSTEPIIDRDGPDRELAATTVRAALGPGRRVSANDVLNQVALREHAKEFGERASKESYIAWQNRRRKDGGQQHSEFRTFKRALNRALGQAA